jgi:mRNA interferase YafQ
MMRQLVLTAKFRRSFRKFVKRDSKLQNRIETTLIQMQQDVFAVTFVEISID